MISPAMMRPETRKIDSVMMRIVTVAAMVAFAAPVHGQDAKGFVVEDVASVAALPPTQPAAGKIAFSDFSQDRLADPISGLMRFSDWAQAKPVQKQFLGLYPAYDEASVTVAGKSRKKRMHVYVAEARFRVDRAADSIDPSRYVAVSFLEKLDPSIRHRQIPADEAHPNKSPQPAAANVDPGRRWCSAQGAICIKSAYKLEGKLPVGVQLVNKLKEGGRKISDTIEFESELRAVPQAEIDAAGLAKLTGVAAPVTGVVEQNIFWVNEVMAFGKLLLVIQPHPAETGKTLVSAFMALGVESDLIEKKKEYGQVPVLRNLIPAQLLAGKSSFNTGNSISAGLPKYARNQIRAVAGLIGKE
jgi:hypothetical protein